MPCFFCVEAPIREVMNAHADDYMHNLAKAALRDLRCSVQLGEREPRERAERAERERESRETAEREPRDSHGTPVARPALAPSKLGLIVARSSAVPFPLFPALAAFLLQSGVLFTGEVGEAHCLAQGEAGGENHWDKFLETPGAQAAARAELEALGVEMGGGL